jgi:hypothetical protein
MPYISDWMSIREACAHIAGCEGCGPKSAFEQLISAYSDAKIRTDRQWKTPGEQSKVLRRDVLKIWPGPTGEASKPEPARTSPAGLNAGQSEASLSLAPCGAPSVPDEISKEDTLLAIAEALVEGVVPKAESTAASVELGQIQAPIKSQTGATPDDASAQTRCRYTAILERALDELPADTCISTEAMTRLSIARIREWEAAGEQVPRLPARRYVEIQVEKLWRKIRSRKIHAQRSNA